MRWKEYPIGNSVSKCQTWNPKSSGTGRFSMTSVACIDVRRVQDRIVSIPFSEFHHGLLALDEALTLHHFGLNGVPGRCY